MPNAGLLTQRADSAEDWRILLLWDDRSSIDYPVTEREVADTLAGHWRVDSEAREIVALPAADRRFPERFEALRARVRLTMKKYARLLGVTRRTLYHWLDTDRPTEHAVEVLEQLTAWADDLERNLPAAEVQRLFDPEVPESIGALLVDWGIVVAAKQVRIVADDAARRRRAERLDTLADGTEGEPPTATADELRAAFGAFTRPQHRPAPAPPEPEPPELNY